jgi:fibronectin-binding autotransporter adhesin
MNLPPSARLQRGLGLLCLLLLLCLPSPARCDVFVWDASTLTDGPQDGGGTWAANAPNWFNQTLALQNQSWINGSHAIFGAGSGAAGTVTLSGALRVGNLTFSAPGSGSYTLSGAGVLTLENSTVTTDAAATISSVLAGDTGWTKLGAAQLTLSGSLANTHSGLTTLGAGRLHLAKAGGATALAGDVQITGGVLTFLNSTHQIHAGANVSLAGAASAFNGTAPNTTAATVTQTLASLTVSGGTFNAGANSVWHIGEVSFVAGDNRTFVGNSGSVQTYGRLSLVGMNGVSSSTAVANGFTIFGNAATPANRTTLTIGAGGLHLEGSRIHLSGGTSGSLLVLDGTVSTGGSTGSTLERVSGGALPPVISLSSSGGTVSRTFDIAGGGANLNIVPMITNGAATAASIVKTGNGTLTLSGTEANSFTGDAIINAGILRLAKSAGIDAVGGNIEVNTGGTLQLGASHQIPDTAGITVNGGTVAAFSTDETIAFYRQLSGGFVTSGNIGHMVITGALELLGGGTLTINSSPGSATPASWDVGSALLAGADILLGGSNGAGNPRTALSIGAGGLTMRGRNLTLNVGDAGTLLNLNGDFTGSGTNNLTTNSSAATQPLLEIGSATRIFQILGGTTTLGVIVNGNDGSLVKTGQGLLQFTAAATYTGSTTVAGGTLSTAGTGGALSGTSGITVTRGGVFQNGSSNTANNNDISNRIQHGASLELAGGAFNHLSAASGSHTQSLTSLSLSGGANTVSVNATTGTVASLTFTGATPYTRTDGTVNFVHNPADGGSIVFSNAPAGTGSVSDGLLVGATLNGSDLVLAQAGVLTAFTDWIPTGTDTWTPGAAMDVTGSNAIPYNSATIRALRFHSEAAFTVDLAGTHTLSTGMLLVAPGVGANVSRITGGELRGPAGGDLIVSQFNTAGSLEIASTIVNHDSPTSLTKTGAGLLLLSGANSYSGITRVHEGLLQAVDGIGLPAASPLVLSGGALRTSTASFTRSPGTGAGQVAVTGGTSGFSAGSTALAVNLGGSGAEIIWGSAHFDPAALLLNATGATAALDFQNGLDLNGDHRTIRVDANSATVSGLIRNSSATAAGLVKTGTGSLRLTQANSFDGGVTVAGGALVVAANGALGSGDITLSGGALQADGAPRTLANRVWLASNSSLSGSQTLTLSGTLAGSGTLTKSGTSVVELSGSNSFTGNVTVSGGILRVLNERALGATSGAITVTGNAHLELGDGIVVTGQPITVSSTSGTSGTGSPTTNRGGLQAGVNARAEWAGPVALGVSQARLGVQEGGFLVISGTITGNVSVTDVRLSGELSGNGGLMLSGSGNSWSGQTEIVRGTVFLGINNALPVDTILDIHFTNTNNSEYAGVDLNGFNQTVASLRNEGNSGLNAELTNRSRQLSTFTIAETGTITYGGLISGNLALVKTGTGITTLSQVNRFTGGLTILEGTVRAGNIAAFAEGDVTVHGGTSTAGKLDLNNISPVINALSGDAGTVAALIANESATAATRTLTVGANHGSGHYAGNLVNNTGGAAQGVLAFAKIGSGTQTLAGNASHSGDTTIANGTLFADYTTGTALSPLSTVRLSGGTLVVANASTASIAGLTLTQSGSDYVTANLRVENGATLTVGTLTGQGFAPTLFDLRDGATLVVNNLATAAVSNGILVQGGSNRGTLYVRDDGGFGYATRNGANEIVRYTGATLLNGTGTATINTENYLINASLTRTAAINFHSLQIDTSAGDVTLNMGSSNLTVGASGRGLLVTGSGDATITGTGAVTGSSIFFANYSSGSLTLDYSLSGQAVIFSGTGLSVYMRAPNPADVYVAGATFRVAGADRTFTSGITRIYGGGVLELGADLNGSEAGDFTRAVGQASGQVALIGNGGFSAHGADRVVALGGVGSAADLTWGATNFLSGPGGDNNSSLHLGSAYSTHTLEFQNNLNLGTRVRRIEVADGVSSDNVDGRLTGVLSGTGSLLKDGTGRLELTAVNTYSGSTRVAAGSLLVASGARTGTGAVTVETGATLLGTGIVQGGDFTLASGASLQGGNNTAASATGTLSFQTTAQAKFVIENGALVMLDLRNATNAGSVDPLFGGHAIGSAGYQAHVDAISGAGDHDRLVFDGGADSSLVWAGQLTVRSDSFTAEFGQVFNLLDWTSSVGVDFSGFDPGSNYRTGADDDLSQLNLPTLDGGLVWDISRFTTSGVIVVVPEPGRAVLAVLGVLSLLLRRRRPAGVAGSW